MKQSKQGTGSRVGSGRVLSLLTKRAHFCKRDGARRCSGEVGFGASLYPSPGDSFPFPERGPFGMEPALNPTRSRRSSRPIKVVPQAQPNVRLAATTSLSRHVRCRHLQRPVGGTGGGAPRENVARRPCFRRPFRLVRLGVRVAHAHGRMRMRAPEVSTNGGGSLPSRPWEPPLRFGRGLLPCGGTGQR